MKTVSEILSGGFERGDEFRAALIKQAEMHDDYLTLARDPLAQRGAANQRNACLRLYDIAGNQEKTIPEKISEATQQISTMVIGVNAAAKLCGIPSHERTAAVVAWEEDHKS